MNELISIIVPVYNMELFLGRCVDSLIRQSYENLEILLIDDGSTDSSPEICDRYEKLDSRIRVIHKDNGGLSDARNIGLLNSTGKFISFIDSDDCVSTKMFEILHKELIQSGAEFIKSDFLKFNTEKEPKTVASKYNVVEYTPLDAVKNFMCTEYSEKKHMKSTVCDGLYLRKVFFDSTGKLVICFPIGKINEDTYIFPQLIFRAKKILHIDLPLYYYYEHEGSITHSKTVSVREIHSRDLWKKVDEKISLYTNEYKQICAENWALRYISLINKIYGSPLEKEYFKEVRKELNNDKVYLLSVIKSPKLRRSLFFIRFYMMYRVLRRFIPGWLY